MVAYWSANRGKLSFSSFWFPQEWAGLWLLSRNFWNGMDVVPHSNQTENMSISTSCGCTQFAWQIKQCHKTLKQRTISGFYWHWEATSWTLLWAKNTTPGSVEIPSLLGTHEIQRNLSCPKQRSSESSTWSSSRLIQIPNKNNALSLSESTESQLPSHTSKHLKQQLEEGWNAPVVSLRVPGVQLHGRRISSVTPPHNSASAWQNS